MRSGPVRRVLKAVALLRTSAWALEEQPLSQEQRARLARDLGIDPDA